MAEREAWDNFKKAPVATEAQKEPDKAKKSGDIDEKLRKDWNKGVEEKTA